MKDVTPLSQELALVDSSEVAFNYCFTCTQEWHVVLIVVASGYTAEKRA